MNRPRIQAAAEMMLEAQQKACPDESWRVILGAGAVLAKHTQDGIDALAEEHERREFASYELLKRVYMRFAKKDGENIRGLSRNLEADIKAFLEKRREEYEYE